MDKDLRNTFGILMCREICDGACVWIYDGAPSTCSSFFVFETNNASDLWILVSAQSFPTNE